MAEEKKGDKKTKDWATTGIPVEKKREGVLCWPITERSNVNTVILPTPFFTTFPLLFTESRTCTLSVEGARVFSFWELSVLQIYTSWKNLFLGLSESPETSGRMTPRKRMWMVSFLQSLAQNRQYKVAMYVLDWTWCPEKVLSNLLKVSDNRLKILSDPRNDIGFLVDISERVRTRKLWCS